MTPGENDPGFAAIDELQAYWSILRFAVHRLMLSSIATLIATFSFVA